MNKRQIASQLVKLAKEVSALIPQARPIIPLTVKKRLDYLRKEIQNESISQEEIHELQSLSRYIDDADIELLEWAGVSEGSRNKVRTCLGQVEKQAEALLDYLTSMLPLIKEARASGDIGEIQDLATNLYDNANGADVELEMWKEAVTNLYNVAEQKMD